MNPIAKVSILSLWVDASGNFATSACQQWVQNSQKEKCWSTTQSAESHLKNV